MNTDSDVHFQKSTSGIDSCDGVGSYDDDRTCSHDDAADSAAGDVEPTGHDVAEHHRNKGVVNTIAQRVASHNLQNMQSLHSLRNVMTPMRHVTPSVANQYTPVPGDASYRGQILGVRNLRSPLGQVLSPTRSIGVLATPPITPCAPSYAKVGCELGPSSEKPRDNDRTISIVDRSNMEFNLNASSQENAPASIGPKKSVKGVKLVGMEGGTLRRPSLQVRDDLDDVSSSSL